MKATEGQLVSGFSITVSRERVSSASARFYSGNEPASVSLFRLGADSHAYMTPEETRQLARSLMAAADVAEGKES